MNNILFFIFSIYNEISQLHRIYQGEKETVLFIYIALLFAP